MGLDLTDPEVAMAEWIALVVAVVAIAVLSWWSAKSPDNGPGDALARKYRNSGGGWGL